MPLWTFVGLAIVLLVLILSFSGLHGGSESAVTGTDTTSPDTAGGAQAPAPNDPPAAGQ